MVVIGAGFAGLSAVRHLRDQPVRVTIVDQHNFHTFQPLLYQVATAGLDPADVAYPVRTIFGREPNVEFRHGRVASVDVGARTVALADGTALPYDRLVVATGATTGYLAVPGASEHSFPLYTLGDARRLRNQVLGRLEAADAHPEDFDGGAPNFVVVGGGATGVEISGALLELLAVSVLRDRLRIDPERSKVVLLEAGDRLLPGFVAQASGYAYETLCSRGVDVRLKTAVAEVTGDGVRLGNGEFDSGRGRWSGRGASPSTVPWRPRSPRPTAREGG